MTIEDFLRMVRDSDICVVAAARWGVDLVNDEITEQNVPWEAERNEYINITCFIETLLDSGLRNGLLQVPDGIEFEDLLKKKNGNIDELGPDGFGDPCRN